MPRVSGLLHALPTSPFGPGPRKRSSSTSHATDLSALEETIMRKWTHSLAVVVSLLLLFPIFARAQTSTSIVTQGLDRTAIWIQTNAVSTSSAMCDGCFGLTPLFNTPGLVGIRCMQPAGTRCIYHISVESAITLTSHENFPIECVSAIRFLVDNHAPTPGPSGSSGPGADSGGLEGYSPRQSARHPTRLTFVHTRFQLLPWLPMPSPINYTRSR